MPTRRLDTLPRTERFAKIARPAAGDDPEVGIGSRYTLKLLVVSILSDRSVLLPSRSLMQWPRSYAPESGGPSGVASPWPANSDRTLPTDHPCRHRPAWPHS